MANIMGKPLEQLFNEFQIDTPQGQELCESVLGSGDVKYHLGTSNDRKIGDKTVCNVEWFEKMLTKLLDSSFPCC